MLENIERAVGDGFALVARFVPQLLLFLVILLIGWLIAKGLRKATNAILERVGFDRAVERGGVGRMLARSKYDASDLIATVVYYAVLLITLQIAFSAFGPNPISDLLTQFVAFLPRIVVAIIIVVIAAAIAVTLPVLITVLATVGGILVVGVGGGLIAPMRQRWETILNRAEQEAPRAAAEARTAPATTAGTATDPTLHTAPTLHTDPNLHTAPTEQMPAPGNGAGSYAPGTSR